MGTTVMKIQGADETKNGGVLVNALQVAQRPARLFSITVFNTGPTQYIQVHDGLTAPVDGNVPKLEIKILGDDDRSIDFTDGRIFQTGIYICNSTTSGVKTLGAANCLIDATYRQEQIRAQNL